MISSSKFSSHWAGGTNSEYFINLYHLELECAVIVIDFFFQNHVQLCMQDWLEVPFGSWFLDNKRMWVIYICCVGISLLPYYLHYYASQQWISIGSVVSRWLKMQRALHKVPLQEKMLRISTFCHSMKKRTNAQKRNWHEFDSKPKIPCRNHWTEAIIEWSL